MKLISCIIIVLVTFSAFSYVVLYANGCITKSRVGAYFAIMAALIVLVAITGLFYATWKQPNVTCIDVTPFKDVQKSTHNVITGNSYSMHIEGLRHLSESERRKIFHEFMEEHGAGSYTFYW